jgi:hypothetical protein
MACNSCIKGNYDFFIREIDSKTFLYQDTSDWQSGTNFCKPDTYKVAIYPPGNSDPIYTDFSTNNSLTKVTLETLGLTDVYSKFKDGVYYFSVEEGSEGYCGIEFKRSVAIIPSLQCCFDKAFMRYALDRRDEINHIEFLVRQVRFNAMIGSIQASEDYYNLAKSALTTLDCDCSF